jgi:23S rRNA (adenine2030-N6)-methyltransferase
MVLCDPSYEMKSDYARVVARTTDAVSFATGTHVVLVPNYSAPGSTRDRRAAENPGGSKAHWLHATLTVKSSKLTTDSGEVIRPARQRHVHHQPAPR